MRMGTSSRPITGSKRGSTRLSCCGEAVIFQVAANMRASSGMWSLPGTRIAESDWRKELAVMKPLPACRLEDYREYRVPVGPWSTVRVGHNTYSVPSRLIRHEVVARLYADHVEIYFAGQRVAEMERIQGEGKASIDYRHVIGSLVRKPGAFERYRYREQMFRLPFSGRLTTNSRKRMRCVPAVDISRSCN